MAKIYRVSGYLESDLMPTALMHEIVDSSREKWQRIHIKESSEFELGGELEENCDLALLERHFSKETEMQFDRPIPKTGQKYIHFKTGKVVTVLALSRHTETEELLVVYEHDGLVWARPLDMFMSKADREKYPDANWCF